MKYLSTIFTLVFFIILTSGSIAQTDWTKDSLNNPILSPGSAGDWDLGPIQHSSVVFVDTLYHMWYCGGGGAIGGCINHATSPDGITWEKDSLHNPVLTKGLPGSWDDDYVFSPSVIYDGVIFHMWYTCVHVTPPMEGIGYATSSDGVIWTKYDDPNTTSTLYAESDPVLIPGSAGSWDEAVVEAPAVIFESNSYNMWYRGRNNSSTQRGIGRAVSSDGISWTKEPANSPVLTPGPGWSWEESWMRLGSVVFDGTKYHLFYYAGAFYTNFRIGYAWSSDGITWTKYDDPTTTNLPFSLSDPVLNWGSSGSWDDWLVLAPWVILETDTFRMWYTGIDPDTITGIGYATAPVDPMGIEDYYENYISEEFTLSQNYPNPFNPSTTIEFKLPKTSEVTLKIFNILGEEVATLAFDRLSAGSYSYEWDASNFSSGIYLYRLQVGNPSQSTGQSYVETRKMVVMK